MPFISTFSGGMSFGRGGNNGLPSYSDLVISSTGSIGMGTTIPGAPLDLYRSGTNDPIARFGSLGTTDNQSISVYNGVTSTKIFASGGTNTFVSGTKAGDGGLMVGTTGNMFFGQGETPVMVIKAGGNVLIGKTSQVNNVYILDINGSARANKVVVNTTGADFVFDSSYQLRSLDSVEIFIQQNKHLPEIEPAADMQKEGVDLGSNQTKLLQKIEELTLYLIEQNKKQEAQEQAIQRLINSQKTLQMLNAALQQKLEQTEK